VTQVNGIAVWAEGIKAELAQRLPPQRKTQRDKLAVLVATMLHVRSANLVEMAASAGFASSKGGRDRSAARECRDRCNGPPRPP